MEEIYTIEELMLITKLSKSTINRHLKSGVLKGNKIGNSWRFTKQQVQDYIDGKHEGKGE